MRRIHLKIPKPILLGSQYRFWRSEVEHEKSRIRALSRGLTAPEYQKPPTDELVSSATVAREFAISGRTLSRRIKELVDSDKRSA